MKVHFRTWKDPVNGEVEVAHVTFTCPFCGKETEFVVDKNKFDKWNSGELVQKAFPNLTPEHRELFITEMCYECQENIFC